MAAVVGGGALLEEAAAESQMSSECLRCRWRPASAVLRWNCCGCWVVLLREKNFASSHQESRETFQPRSLTKANLPYLWTGLSREVLFVAVLFLSPLPCREVTGWMVTLKTALRLGLRTSPLWKAGQCRTGSCVRKRG